MNQTTTKKLRKTPYLIQRLLKPYQNDITNPFAFGGSPLKNGGLSDQAMKLLKDIWRYDYMGSSEFEWGAVPKSLQYIAQNQANYITGQFEATATAKDFYAKPIAIDITKTATIYFVCEVGLENEIKEWITKFCAKKQDYRTKEMVNLAEHICGFEYQEDKAGWHDIDNHYLFFTDKEMFDKFCQLFSIKQH